MQTFDEPGALDFFQKRPDALLVELPNETLRRGFAEMAANLNARVAQVGGLRGSLLLPYRPKRSPLTRGPFAMFVVPRKMFSMSQLS